MPGLIEHIERYLGTIQRGWKVSPDGAPMPFQVVECRRTAIDDVIAFITLGLSHTELAMSECPDCGPRTVRQELLFLARTGGGDLPVPSLLQQVGQEALRQGTAYLRGEVIGPRGPLFGSRLEALYVAAPVYQPDEFAGCTEVDGTERVIAWLVPITGEEAAFVRSWGWRAFESLLVEKNPDLTDTARLSVV